MGKTLATLVLATSLLIGVGCNSPSKSDFNPPSDSNPGNNLKLEQSLGIVPKADSIKPIFNNQPSQLSPYTNNKVSPMALSSANTQGIFATRPTFTSSPSPTYAIPPAIYQVKLSTSTASTSPLSITTTPQATSIYSNFLRPEAFATLTDSTGNPKGLKTSLVASLINGGTNIQFLLNSNLDNQGFSVILDSLNALVSTGSMFSPANDDAVGMTDMYYDSIGVLKGAQNTIYSPSCSNIVRPSQGISLANMVLTPEFTLSPSNNRIPGVFGVVPSTNKKYGVPMDCAEIGDIVLRIPNPNAGQLNQPDSYALSILDRRLWGITNNIPKIITDFDIPVIAIGTDSYTGNLYGLQAPLLNPTTSSTIVKYMELVKIDPSTGALTNVYPLISTDPNFSLDFSNQFDYPQTLTLKDGTKGSFRLLYNTSLMIGPSSATTTPTFEIVDSLGNIFYLK